MSQEKVVFYFIRHGETMLNVHNRLQGWSDAPLTPKGEADTFSLAKGLKDSQISFKACYSSDSGRSQQTANIILKNIKQPNLSLKIDPRLREYSFGNLESELGSSVLQTVEENLGEDSLFSRNSLVKGKDGFIPKITNEIVKLDANFSTDKNITWPAESFQKVIDRMTNILDEIKEEALLYGGGNILVVSHGLSIISLVQHLAPEKEIPLNIKNGSYTRIIWDKNEYRVEEFGSLEFYSNT